MITTTLGRRRVVLGLLGLLGIAALASLTITPLREYVAGATIDRGVNEPSYVIAAAGDIACSARRDSQVSERAKRLPTTDTGVPADARPARACAARATADLLRDMKPVAVLPLGDLQYECGDAADFTASYAATWGPYRSITHPVVGNHEYGKICGRNDASGYFDYFGSTVAANEKGWFSFDIGGWHLIGLNSQCSYGKGPAAVGGCHTGSEQHKWLMADLAAHQNSCTLAYWHEPRFTSGLHGSALQMGDIWNDLVRAKVDVALAGHNHVYERFEPIGLTDTPARTDEEIFQQPNLDPRGIQQFVVGTGGSNHVKFAQPPLVGEAVRDDTTFGVLKLTLKPGRYDWEFVPVKGGKFTDKGSAKCR